MKRQDKKRIMIIVVISLVTVGSMVGALILAQGHGICQRDYVGQCITSGQTSSKTMTVSGHDPVAGTYK